VKIAVTEKGERGEKPLERRKTEELRYIIHRSQGGDHTCPPPNKMATLFVRGDQGSKMDKKGTMSRTHIPSLKKKASQRARSMKKVKAKKKRNGEGTEAKVTGSDWDLVEKEKKTLGQYNNASRRERAVHKCRSGSGGGTGMEATRAVGEWVT